MQNQDREKNFPVIGCGLGLLILGAISVVFLWPMQKSLATQNWIGVVIWGLVSLIAALTFLKINIEMINSRMPRDRRVQLLILIAPVAWGAYLQKVHAIGNVDGVGIWILVSAIAVLLLVKTDIMMAAFSKPGARRVQLFGIFASVIWGFYLCKNIIWGPLCMPIVYEDANSKVRCSSSNPSANDKVRVDILIEGEKPGKRVGQIVRLSYVPAIDQNNELIYYSKELPEKIPEMDFIESKYHYRLRTAIDLGASFKASEAVLLAKVEQAVASSNAVGDSGFIRQYMTFRIPLIGAEFDSSKQMTGDTSDIATYEAIKRHRERKVKNKEQHDRQPMNAVAAIEEIVGKKGTIDETYRFSQTADGGHSMAFTVLVITRIKGDLPDGFLERTGKKVVKPPLTIEDVVKRFHELGRLHEVKYDTLLPMRVKYSDALVQIPIKIQVNGKPDDLLEYRTALFDLPYLMDFQP